MISHDQKAIALLRLLGPQVTEAVLAELAPDRSSALRRQLDAADRRLPVARQLDLLEEFDRLLDLVKDRQPGVRLFNPGPDAPASPPPPQRPARAAEFILSGDHLADLERIQAHRVAGALEHEQPRGIAAVLGQLSAERTAEVLSLISEAKRSLVVRELSSAARTHPILIERMAETILARAITLPAEAPQAADRIQRLADVVRAVDRNLRRQMLDAIREQDPDTAEQLLERMYVFSDIVGLKDRQVQKLLGEIDATTISTAMFGADEAVRSKVLNNLSRRARESLEEEMSFQTDVPEAIVTDARKTVARAIASLDEEG
ncbi:MAG: FliG C-terminal domain-containing protein [Planctomycetaceae bacterium]